MRHRLSISNLLLGLLLLTTYGAVLAESESTVAEWEIQRLLTAIGEADCQFHRNGKSYSATKAESHLRMKYQRGKRYAKSAEQFIDRLASRSSMSRKAYRMQCSDGTDTESGAWLHKTLLQIRAENAGPTQ